jgi:hypothetical protein
VRTQLLALQQQTEADEFMVVSDVFDPDLRLRSLSLLAQAWGTQPQVADQINV